MPSMTGGITRTQRILGIYLLFWMSDEVFFDDFYHLCCFASKKTILRDIAVLKKVGVKIKYSTAKKAYYVKNREGMRSYPPTHTENTEEERFLNKIKRLIGLCGYKLPENEDLADYYNEILPGFSKRTMQRDFAILNSIGYDIRFNRDEDWDEDRPLGHYYCFDQPCAPNFILLTSIDEDEEKKRKKNKKKKVKVDGKWITPEEGDTQAE